MYLTKIPELSPNYLDKLIITTSEVGRRTFLIGSISHGHLSFTKQNRLKNKPNTQTNVSSKVFTRSLKNALLKSRNKDQMNFGLA